MTDQEIIDRVLNRYLRYNDYPNSYQKSVVQFWRILVRYTRCLERAKSQKPYKKVSFEELWVRYNKALIGEL